MPYGEAQVYFLECVEPNGAILPERTVVIHLRKVQTTTLFKHSKSV